MRMPSLCLFCKHYHEKKCIEPEDEYEETFHACDAYPKGIPHAVEWGGHLYPKPNDMGIRFELKDGVKLPEYLRQTEQEEKEAYQDEYEYYSKPPSEREELR